MTGYIVISLTEPVTTDDADQNNLSELKWTRATPGKARTNHEWHVFTSDWMKELREVLSKLEVKRSNLTNQAPVARKMVNLTIC